jgi:hypothetical protein
MQRSYRNWIYVGVAVFLIAVAISFFFFHRTHKVEKSIAKLTGYCVGADLTSGSSGHCVSDVQTIINYMEHSGLTQCEFVGGANLTINGNYDTTTSAQVKSVQDWADCYATQEGFTSNVKDTGVVDRPTWGELCTYGYTDPIHSSASGAGGTIAAGKDAGCAQLPS